MRNIHLKSFLYCLSENVVPFLSTSKRTCLLCISTYTDAIYDASGEHRIKVMFKICCQIRFDLLNIILVRLQHEK